MKSSRFRVETDGRSVSEPPRERSQRLIGLLPPVIRIGPHDYAIVVMDRHYSTAQNIDGQHASHEGLIRISDSFATPSRACEVFVHECLHALFDVFGFRPNDDEERVVDGLSFGLAGLFRDNPWLAGWVGETTQ